MSQISGFSKLSKSKKIDWIIKTFFKNDADWKIDGVGKMNSVKGNDDDDIESTRFHIRNGVVKFHEKNFKPEGVS